MTASMQVRCAWCKADMGTKPCSPEMAGQVSHGMCAACAKVWWANRTAGRGRRAA